MFPARQEKLDWQLIAELEPVVLVGGSPEEIGNYQQTSNLPSPIPIFTEKLQDVLVGLAFCNLEHEFGREMLEGTRGLAKIFRLSQLVIQYLIYCQVSDVWWVVQKILELDILGAALAQPGEI